MFDSRSRCYRSRLLSRHACVTLRMTQFHHLPLSRLSLYFLHFNADYITSWCETSTREESQRCFARAIFRKVLS
ncbi:hypothetical protein PUN28_018312 [Cardiocondyla obscurior]|uniref:Uncharacterized protein n=1 Tax=Cardiocondyla obscurior TaxID=286306 RepID=A0AAW2EGU0_9HYME